MKSDTIKIILSTFTALTGIGGSYWKMEDRVSKLEEQMNQKESISVIELEIASLRRDKELIELKYAMRDSLRMEMARYKDKRRK
mgnify:CR=1 FL=1